MLKPLIVAIAVLLIVSCTSEPTWTADQKAVLGAAQKWDIAKAQQDYAAMWDLLSPDAQELYDRELRGTPGVRQTVKLAKAALQEGSRISDADRQKRIDELAQFPDDPDKMDSKAWYIWRTERDMAKQGPAGAAALFAREYIKSISIQGEEATIVLKQGNPDRYSWVRVSGDWKFSPAPSTMRALDEARQRESAKK